MNENKLDYYMNLKYEVVVEPSDDGYVVYIPELPGCITQTDDASEIIPMITDAKRCWFIDIYRSNVSRIQCVAFVLFA